MQTMELLAVLLAVSLQLNEVNVTGHRSEIESGNMRIVTTLTAEEVRLLPVKTVEDLLRYIPGVDVRQRDLANGKKTMKAYLWKVCGEAYDAEHPRN